VPVGEPWAEVRPNVGKLQRLLAGLRIEQFAPDCRQKEFSLNVADEFRLQQAQQAEQLAGFVVRFGRGHRE